MSWQHSSRSVLSKTLRLAVLLTAAFFVRTAFSLSPASSPTGSHEPNALAVGPRPLIEMTALGDPMNRVGDPVFVVVSLRNLASQPLTIVAVDVGIDPSASTRLDGGGLCDLVQAGEVHLAPGEVFQRTCRFPLPSKAVTSPSDTAHIGADNQPVRDGWHAAGSLERLRSADVRLAADVRILGREWPLRLYTTVQVAASDFSLFAGGVAGAVLLSLFVWLERLLRQPDARQRWLVDLGLMLLIGLRGGLIAAIVLLLSKTTQGASVPITIAVADFSGGLLVGLFSYPLASWIWSTLNVEGTAGPAPTASAQPSAAPIAPPVLPPAPPP